MCEEAQPDPHTQPDEESRPVTELLRVSPTSFTTFDTDSAFGCKRRWWFKYVLKLEDPPGEGAILGDKVHKRIENPGPNTLDDLITSILSPASQYINEVHAGGWHLEVAIDDSKLIPGCRVTGRIDALNPEKRTIRDWKTMKTLQYAKPSMMLAKDIQMNIYAAALAEPGEDIIVEHISITTTAPYQALRTAAVSTPETRAVVFDKALALAEGMLQYKSISDVNETEADRSKCRFCAFKNRCPTGEKTVNLLNTLLGTPAITPATAAPVTAAVVPTGILPPEVAKPAEPFKAVPPPRSTPPMPIPGRKLVIQEAPPEVVEAPPAPFVSEPTSTPTATAQPAPSSDEAPKRGRGRPPGAKNKPKDEVVVYTPGQPLDAAGLEVTSITVTRGATVQVVQFEPMRIEVTATANVSGLTVAEAVQELDAQVLAEVVRRMQEMQAAKVGGK